MAKKKKGGLLNRLFMGSEKSEGYARSTLPSNRWELFWDIFKGRFGKLIKINLLILLFCIPFFAMLLFTYLSTINYGVIYPFSQSFGVGYGALPSMVGAQESIAVSVNSSMLLLSPIAFFIAGIGLAGGAYVMRNMVWTEGIFVANDFWRGIKLNFKQIVLIMLLYSVVFYITILSITLCDRNIVYGVGSVWLFKVAKVISYIVLILFTAMTLHMIPMSVTYEMKLRHIIKNSFAFTIGLLPHNVIFLALGIIPFLLFLFDGLIMFIGVVLLILFSISYFLLVWTNFCQWGYDKFLNDKVAGAQKNKGMYKKVKKDESGAIKQYKEQLAMQTRSSLNSKPIKPITDEELTLAELPTSFNRSDIEKLNQSRQALYDDHSKYVEEHKNDPEFMQTEQEIEAEKQRQEREKRIEKARRELAKRKRKK